MPPSILDVDFAAFFAFSATNTANSSRRYVFCGSEVGLTSISARMSALGQKRTFHVAAQESALPPKADIGAALQNVRLVPIADMSPSQKLFSEAFTDDACSKKVRQCIPNGAIRGAKTNSKLTFQLDHSVETGQ